MERFARLMRRAMGLPPWESRGDEAPGAGMAGDANDFDPTHPLSKYQDRIPKRYLEQGWRVVDIESAFGGNLFRAYLRRPWHDELIVSDDWCSNIDRAVENAIERLMEERAL
jgi:hypothetical protein